METAHAELLHLFGWLAWMSATVWEPGRVTLGSTGTSALRSDGSQRSEKGQSHLPSVCRAAPAAQITLWFLFQILQQLLWLFKTLLVWILFQLNRAALNSLSVRAAAAKNPILLTYSEKSPNWESHHIARKDVIFIFFLNASLTAGCRNSSALVCCLKSAWYLIIFTLVYSIRQKRLLLESKLPNKPSSHLTSFSPDFVAHWQNLHVVAS